MKKKLLFFASALLLSVSAFAQWEKPTCTGAELQYSTLAAGEVAGDTIAYYLYNEEAGMFYTQGNAWGTQASVGKHPSSAIKTFFVKYIGAEESEWDGTSFNVYDYPPTKGKWMNLFVDGDQAMYVDHGSQLKTMIFGAEKNGDAYRFYVNGRESIDTGGCWDRETYPTHYLGIDKSMNDTILYPLLNLAEESVEDVYLVDFKLIPVTDTEFMDKYMAYTVSGSLADAIAEAEASEYASALTDAINAAKDVYNNTSSTVADITAAIDALKIAMNYASVMGATEDNPKDATGFITNNDFSAGNIGGWTCTFVAGTNATNVGYQSASYDNGDVSISGFIEAWAAESTSFNPNCSHRAIGDGKLSQIMPNLPQGKYKFTCDAIANYQDNATVSVTGVEIFATGGSLTAKQAIHTGNGAPEHFELTFINPGGDVELGLRTNNADANWIAADNFTLTYYGEFTDDPEKVLMDEVVKQALEAYPLDELEELLANKTVKNTYQQAIEDAQAATSDYTAKGDAVAEAKQALETSVAAYAAYKAEVDYIAEYLASHDLTSEDAMLLSDYVMEGSEIEPDEDYPLGNAEYIYNYLLPTDEEITTETKRITEQLSTAIATSLKAGDDCTDMIADANFASATGKGWTKGGNCTNLTWTGGLIPSEDGSVGFPVAESWHSTFDIYQVIEGAPDGVYSLSLNGFCRADGGETTSPAEVYMNDYATPLMFITEDQLPADQAQDGFNCYLTNGNTSAALTENPVFAGCKRQSSYDATDVTGDVGYYPNGMEGASVAFSAGRYQATAYGMVTGGKMTIGVRNLTSSTVWALWGNFKLTYLGNGGGAYGEQIDAIIAKLEVVFDEATIYGNDAQTKVDDAIKALEAARNSADGDVCLAAVNQGQEALEYAQASITAYEDLSETSVTLGEAIENYAETAEPDVVEAANTTLDDITDAIDYKNKTNEEVAGLINAANGAMSQLKMPAGTKDATDEEPVDLTCLINNPTFDDANLDGWEGTAWGRGGTVADGAEHYNMQFDTYQTISGLYPGVYAVDVQGFYRRGSGENDYKVFNSTNPDSLNNVVVYAQAGEDEWQTPICAPSSVCLNEAELSEIGVATSACTSVEQDVYIPNTMLAADGWFNELDKYHNRVYAKVGEEGTLTLGTKFIAAATVTYDWSLFDNWKLIYFGKNSKIDPATGVQDIKSVETVTMDGIFNLAGQKLSAPQKGINIINGKKVLVK